MNISDDQFPFQTIEFIDTCDFCGTLDQWCIVIIEQGNGSYFYQNVIYDFEHRDSFLIYGKEHVTLSNSKKQSCRFSAFFFAMEDVDLYNAAEASRRLLKQFFHKSTPFQRFSLPRKNYEVLHSYLNICTQIYRDVFPVSPMIYKHTFFALLLYFAQTGFILKPEKKQDTKESSSKEIIIAQVKYLIRQNYADPLPLAYIADYVYTNPSYLSRIFKAETGICLSAFINQVRIENAKHLLEDSDELIIDIAVSCGFNQIPHFNRVFKEFTGMSPSLFRKTYRYHN